MVDKSSFNHLLSMSYVTRTFTRLLEEH